MPMDPQDYRALVRLVAAEQAKWSSSSFLFDNQDRLRVHTFGSLASVVVAIEGRMLTPQGDLVNFAETHTPNSDRTVNRTLHGVGPGFLLNLQLRASTGTPRRGQVYAIVEVVRGLGATIQPVATLFAGYVTDTSRIAWPGTAIAGSTEGPGVIRSIAGTNPAAGVEISETVPTNARWRLLSLLAQLVTDATAASRLSTLIVDDGTTNLLASTSALTQTASQTVTYTGTAFGQLVTVTGAIAAWALPPALVLMGGHRIRTSTGSIQAGDNWGAPQLLVEEWIED